MTSKDAERYMRLALGLAAKGEGRTHPNPMVGAVIVSSGKIIAQGYHKKAGAPHAEAAAIRKASTSLKGAEMFVTLEPCDHFGRTPPCTEAIIKSGISKVYAAIVDPNPLNSGRGIRKLRRNGIDVNVGVCGNEANFLNRAYIKYITSGYPYITVKSAQSLDGKIAAYDGSSKWISSPASRKYVKKLRSKSDAVMVGINTIIRDDPTLMSAGRSGKKVYRIVLDTRLRIPENSRIVKTSREAPLLLVTTSSAPKKKVMRLSRIEGVEVVIAKSHRGRVDLTDFSRKMAARGLINILSEAGGELTGALMDRGLVDEVIFFVSPKILGGMRVSVSGRGSPTISEAVKLKDSEIFMSGPDIAVRGRIAGKVHKSEEF